MKVRFDQDGYVESYADEGFELPDSVEVSEIPEEFCATNCKHYHLLDGVLVLDDEKCASEQLLQSKLARISELKLLLDETDYQAIKYAEELTSTEEYEPVRLQRQVWREEINCLRDQVNNSGVR